MYPLCSHPPEKKKILRCHRIGSLYWLTGGYRNNQSIKHISSPRTQYPAVILNRRPAISYPLLRPELCNHVRRRNLLHHRPIRFRRGRKLLRRVHPNRALLRWRVALTGDLQSERSIHGLQPAESRRMLCQRGRIPQTASGVRVLIECPIFSYICHRSTYLPAYLGSYGLRFVHSLMTSMQYCPLESNVLTVYISYFSLY